MDKLMQSLVDAPLANALKLNLVEVEGQPKKRAARKVAPKLFDTPAPIIRNARDHREREAAKKVTALLDHFIPLGKSDEWIHEHTRIDLETIKRGREVRGL